MFNLLGVCTWYLACDQQYINIHSSSCTVRVALQYDHKSKRIQVWTKSSIHVLKYPKKRLGFSKNSVCFPIETSLKAARTFSAFNSDSFNDFRISISVLFASQACSNLVVGMTTRHVTNREIGILRIPSGPYK